jgi:hypothetical protein
MHHVIIKCGFDWYTEIKAITRAIPSIKLTDNERRWWEGGYKLPPLTCDEYNLLIQCLLLERPYPLTFDQRDALPLLTRILENTEVERSENAPSFN